MMVAALMKIIMLRNIVITVTMIDNHDRYSNSHKMYYDKDDNGDNNDNNDDQKTNAQIT